MPPDGRTLVERAKALAPLIRQHADQAEEQRHLSEPVAVALAEAGCFALVLECVPDGVARMVTDAIDIPTIGIGAGRHCDGQVLVYHDLLGLEDRKLPKFVRRYDNLRESATAAVASFVEDVRTGTFPSSEETYHMTDQMEAFDLYAQPAPVAVPPAG